MSQGLVQDPKVRLAGGGRGASKKKKKRIFDVLQDRLVEVLSRYSAPKIVVSYSRTFGCVGWAVSHITISINWSPNLHQDNAICELEATG